MSFELETATGNFSFQRMTKAKFMVRVFVKAKRKPGFSKFGMDAVMFIVFCAPLVRIY